MLNWKSGTTRIPQNVTTLSISWLNSQFVAMAIHRGVVEGTWKAAFTAETEPDFASLVREAVQKTNYHGTTVSLLLANAKLAQQLVDVPRVTGSGLTKIIQREAQQQKLFNGEAAWTFQNSLTVKDVPRVILHLLPKTLLDQFVQACQTNELHLNSVAPVSAVLHQQLLRLPLNKGDVAMLAAETGGSTTVVVGRADGQLLLVRTLLDNWNTNEERLALDLKRTLSFITQQYDLNINRGVWLFGPGAEQQASVLQVQLEHPVAVSPVECLPDYWTVEAAKLRPASSPNFIGLELQAAPRRRIFARIVAAATVLIVVAALTVASLLHRQAALLATQTDILRKRADQLQSQHQDLEQRNTKFAAQRQLIKLVLADQHPPVPVWVLGYLNAALPVELAATNLQVKWEDDLWKLSLAGTLQGSNQPPASTTLSNAVGVLCDRLTGDPFHLTILQRSDRPEPAREKSTVPGGWPARSTPQTLMTNQFQIEGVMR